MESRCSDERCYSWGRWEVLASPDRPDPLRIRLGSLPPSLKYDVATIFSLSPLGDLTLLAHKCVFYHFSPHRDERLRQHGVAAASSSPGRTDDSAILGQLRLRSANQLTY